MNKPVETNIIGELRLEYISKISISGKDLIVTADFISSCTSAELAKVTVSADINMKNIGLNKRKIRLGSGTKIDKFQDLLKVSILFIFFYFSNCGADEF